MSLDALRDLAREYRPTMDKDVVHLWGAEVTAAITAYLASIQAEPVAWQHKSESGVWHHHDEDEHEEFAHLGFQVRCLYAAPIQAEAVDRDCVIEEAARIADGHTYSNALAADDNTLIGMFARGNRNAKQKIAEAIRSLKGRG